MGGLIARRAVVQGELVRGNCLSSKFPGDIFMRGNCPGGICPGGKLADTEKSALY